MRAGHQIETVCRANARQNVQRLSQAWRGKTAKRDGRLRGLMTEALADLASSFDWRGLDLDDVLVSSPESLAEQVTETMLRLAADKHGRQFQTENLSGGRDREKAEGESAGVLGA